MRDWTKRPTTEVIVVINARVLMVWAQKVEAKKGVNKKYFSGNGYSISQLIKFLAGQGENNVYFEITQNVCT